MPDRLEDLINDTLASTEADLARVFDTAWRGASACGPDADGGAGRGYARQASAATG